MRPVVRPSVRRGPFAAGLLLLAAGAAAAPVGGGYFAVTGPGRITVKGAEASPVDFEGNLRFDFDGEDTDLEGGGTVLAYDDPGQKVIGDFPFAWSTRKGAAFRADLLGAEFEEYLAARIEEAAGGTATVTLASAAAKGRMRRSDGTLRVSVLARGEAVVAGGPARKLKLKLKLR